jgi:hypothetical protein
LVFTPFVESRNVPLGVTRRPKATWPGTVDAPCAPWAFETSRTGLLAKPKPGNCCAVPFDVLARQVRQEPTPLPDEFEKPPPRVEVMLMLAQVIRESVDSLGEEGNLNLGRTGIIIMRAKLGDDGLFLFALESHTCRIPSGKTRSET